MLVACKAPYSLSSRSLRVSRDSSMSKMMIASSDEGFPDTGLFSHLCGLCDTLLSFLNFSDKLTNSFEFQS